MTSNEHNFDVNLIRKDFPVLDTKVRDKPLVYFDNAASSLTPEPVLERINQYYHSERSNIHRGVHLLSQLATEAYDGAREKVQNFINAKHVHEIVFTSGTTESINLAAYSMRDWQAGDEVIVSQMEHHSNIVPWQLLADEKGIVLKVIDITEEGELKLDSFEALITKQTKLLSIAHVSNALGTINPVQDFIELAHKHDIPVLLDGAQSAPHMPIDVQALDCEFYAFSAHKLCGPTGVGVLYGKEALLNEMKPWKGGGDMILSVSFSGTTYNEIPYKFEAGTPNIAGVIGLGAAIDYLQNIGLQTIADYEAELIRYAHEKLQIPGLACIGTAANKAAVFSFTLEGMHPHDIGTMLDLKGIAIRAGHHCAQPLMEFYGISATARASFAFYNTKAEIDFLAEQIPLIQEVFA
ncbi:MAG: cysteine desulfurase [Lentisphaeria bacterium]|nr:cysteine desulfurase [Lentisphaeria bacterium]NQZ67948.1 cysteine desulfurase [Lentisphaeria bacterium]